ncbi:vezatin isoform X2 [Eucyclogobius newberryi]|uniref:vezatin isoform X2 n=1 Tax=Eucyclogobius newberryi TaxID=166745 RepID=UPI003B5C7095
MPGCSACSSHVPLLVLTMQNSPLFQYLHDLGHTDFEACPIASRENECVELEENIASFSKGKQHLGGKLWRLADALWQWTPFHQAVTTRKLQQQLDTVFGQYSVGCILDQDVLLQEDVELIELLDPSLLTLELSPSDLDSRARTIPKPSFIFKPSIWDLTVLVGLASVLISVCSDGLWALAAVPWVLALLTWVGLKGSVLWRRGRMQKAVYIRATELQTIVHNSKTLTGLSRKALRLIQETEVISRGFTLLLDRVSAASTFSRAAPGTVPRGQQLIGLRKTLYRVLRSAFRASRRATCHMLKAFPLNSEIDNVTNYVSAVPLKELGLGLGLEHLGDELAQELTDDYSLPALKMLFQLWQGQSSECFRRLALLLSPQRIEELAENASKEEPYPVSPLYQTISAVTEPLYHSLANSLCDMQRSYDFHRHFETQTRGTISHRAGAAKEKCRALNTLHTSIRSLQLHLKTLLSEMIILEDDLEQMMVSKDPTEMPFEGYQDFSDRLHQLQPHMQASAGCWEDTIGQVDRMLKRAGVPEDAKQYCPPTYDIADLPKSYPIILDRDPVPEELEWEAYVSDSDTDSEGRGSWCDMLSPEERERQRREREESRRVLSELKSVLCFRASEGERMKRKQLLFNDQAAETPATNSETSDSTASTPKPTVTLISVESIEPNREERKELSEYITGNEEEGRLDPSETPAMEFSCGEPVEAQTGKGLVCQRGGGGASEHYQYDGVPVEEGEKTNFGNLIKDKVPTVSVLDRLTEIHGSQALSCCSTLASQVAARSRSLMTMEEQTFGDDNDDDNENEQVDRNLDIEI